MENCVGTESSILQLNSALSVRYTEQFIISLWIRSKDACLTIFKRSSLSSALPASLKESVIEGTTYAKTSNGGIILEKADFKSDASCLTSNGTISGSIMGSEEDFYYKCSTSNGDCNLPNDFGVGAKTLTLKTSNGDIKISFIKKAE